MNGFVPTERSKLRRLYQRGSYDRAAVFAILDASLFCHIGYVIDGQPYVTPTGYWREGDWLYWHGSSASRMLRSQSPGIPICFSVMIVDGLVLARSGFHHSVNHRSVMAFGRAAKIEDGAEKTRALETYIARFLPGRNRELRPIDGQELKATTVLGMTIEEASAKVRTGPPVDDEPDYALPVWAGVVPIRQVFGAPVADPRLAPGTPIPAHVAELALVRSSPNCYCEGTPMLSEDTADCLALANTAILIRLIEKLAERDVIASPTTLLREAVSDLESCPDLSTRVEDAIRLIRKELMPRIVEPTRAS